MKPVVASASKTVDPESFGKSVVREHLFARVFPDINQQLNSMRL